MYKMKKNHFI